MSQFFFLTIQKCKNRSYLAHELSKSRPRLDLVSRKLSADPLRYANQKIKIKNKTHSPEFKLLFRDEVYLCVKISLCS